MDPRQEQSAASSSGAAGSEGSQGKSQGQAQAQGQAQGQARPRKFVIQSNFGNARQKRSRKNRPCDACRKRKTGCVITSGPPCLFCKSRGLVCESSGPIDPNASSDSHTTFGDDAQSAGTSHSGYGEGSSAPRRNSITSSDSRQYSSSGSTQSPHQTSLADGTGSDMSQAPARVVHQGLVDSPIPAAGQLPEASLSYQVSPRMAPRPPQTLYALEDAENRTAHFMGPAAEQDTYLLDDFRCLVLSERYNVDANIVQVFPGSSHPDDHPVHFLLLMNGHPDHTVQAKQDASDAIETKAWPHGPDLIRLYFKYVHNMYPVVSKTRFLRQYTVAKHEIPGSLRGAIYALASVFWDRDPRLKGPCPFEQHEIVKHAHMALRRDLENPNLFNLQACLLLIHVMPPVIDSAETPNTWIQTAQTVACGQMIGLHVDPSRWNIEPWEKKARRKLWWAVFASDCWSAICHGNPPHIGKDTFDTFPPTLDDIRFDEDVPEEFQHLVEPEDAVFQMSTAVGFLEMIKIARIARDIQDTSCQINPSTSKVQQHQKLVMLHERLKDWQSSLPQILADSSQHDTHGNTRNTCPLLLSFYATQVLLFRGLMSPATREAKATPGSFLRQSFATALSEFEPFATFITSVQLDDLKEFWGRHARSQLILCGNFLIYLFLLAVEPRDIEMAYRMLEACQSSLHRLAATDQVNGKTILRPTSIRVDSFFTQAAQVIRQGNSGSLSPPGIQR